jgi:RimJ/RimL family protein N-acetyltransferase
MSTARSNHDGRTGRLRPARRVGLDTIGPVRIDDVDVMLRPPRLTDGPEWRRVRIADESRLRAAFREGDASWAEQSSSTAWADRLLMLRGGARAGSIVPFVFATTDDHLLGECVFSIDPRSGLAELSLWTARAVPHSVSTAATALGVLRMFEHPPAVPWMVAPVASSNPGPARLLAEAGFEPGATARRLRLYDGVPTDHVIWRLENTERTRTHLRGVLDRYQAGSPSDAGREG